MNFLNTSLVRRFAISLILSLLLVPQAYGEAGATEALKNKIISLGEKYQASRQEVQIAVSMGGQGWRYTLPQPKSAQAAWGNRDGRTTWWYGYWKNTATGVYSDSTPVAANGSWIGDGQNNKGYYRRGGSPLSPTKIELIMSEID